MAGQSRIEAAEWPTSVTASPLDQSTTEASFDTSTQAGLEAWIYWYYLRNGFRPDGSFKGLSVLRKYLFSLDTGISNTRIRQAIYWLLEPNHKYSLAHTERISKCIREINTKKEVAAMPGSASASSWRRTSPRAVTRSPSLTGDVSDPSTRTMGRMSPSKLSGRNVCSESDTQDDDSSNDSSAPLGKDHPDMDFLLSDARGEGDRGKTQRNGEAAWIQYAPLIDSSIISSDTERLLPQYGLLGSHSEAGDSSKLLLNTNIPFSMFLCGVQGSGKSHTTSCVLENSLVPSRYLGKLQNPLSALVFSYAPFSGDGVGFTVSEAAFLASPDPTLPGGAHVKKVHVLVSPSNYVRIAKLYLRLPNVTVTPFKLNPRDLDIDTMLTLMNVCESDETPLYMAQVTQILREMSTAGGPFNYRAFKQCLNNKNFNPAQVSMLKMRLDLLESFLEMGASCPQPHFQPGEITIMDMSCPFVDANTACILFRIGLNRYLQSSGNAKMVVLDEAHKYMLDVPGAKSLNESLLQTIRLQRHYGARVVVSTQEPTLLTDLIALCSITVIHRFSSPEWLAAIRRHVPTAAEDRETLIQRIEGLTRGTAIVYSPSALLGRDESGSLITGTSRLVNVSIRRRITSDGGQSVLAV